jgi:hypothetical protein
MKHTKRIAVILLCLAGIAGAAERAKSLYKVSHISPSVVGISCPGNNGDPTVVTNISGTLLVSCGR